jgi:phage baseplate assembly protein W
MLSSQKKTIIGRGWAFPVSFSREHAGPETVSDFDEIDQSLTILLGTTRGERPMRPDYGCDLRKYVFENMDDALANYLQNQIRIAINKYEPRIEIEAQDYQMFPKEGRVDFQISYRVRATSQKHNFVWPFYLEGGVSWQS